MLNNILEEKFYIKYYYDFIRVFTSRHNDYDMNDIEINLVAKKYVFSHIYKQKCYIL